MTIAIPSALPPGLEAYARSPEFTSDSLPESLQAAHATKAGVWAVIHVLEGAVRYSLEAPHGGEVVAQAGDTVIIEPTVPHHVRFLRPGRMFVEFHRGPTSGPMYDAYEPVGNARS